MTRKHSLDALFALLLYGLFALLSLLLVLIGAQVYKNIVATSDAHSTVRASLSYVANKVRAGDVEGGIRIETRQDLPLLVLEEQAGGATYETLIYYYDGALRERFQHSGAAFDPANGETLTALDGFALSQEDDLLVVTVRDGDGQEHSLHIARRAGS